MPRSSRSGMCAITCVSAPGPVRHHLRPDQQLARLLQRVVVPLPDGAGVFRAAPLAHRLQHRLPPPRCIPGSGSPARSRPCRRWCSPARTAHRTRPRHLALGCCARYCSTAALASSVRSSKDAPAAAAASRIWSVSPRSSAGQLAGQPVELLHPRRRDRPGRHRVREMRVPAQGAHLRHRRLRVAGLSAGSSRASHAEDVPYPSRVVRVGGVEPAQEPGLGGGELGLQLAEARSAPRPARPGPAAPRPARPGSPALACATRSASATLPGS